jgi:hypothetical protein
MIAKASSNRLGSQVAAALLFAAAFASHAQQPTAPLRPAQAGPMVRDYAGPQVRIPGIFVTPIPNAPFSATVNIVSHQRLTDGTEHVVTTVNHIARASSGIIYNERRRLVPVGFQGEPMLLEGHIYNPSDHRSIFLEPPTRLARESILPRPPAQIPGPTAPGPKLPGTVETDLGAQNLNGVELRGLRRERTIPAERSGTGQPVVITDDYWYSPDLFVYLIIRHDNPRTGEQIVAVSEIDRHEPDGTRFVVPQDYKVVDETPPTEPNAAR